MTGSLALRAWLALSAGADPLARAWLSRRAARGKEDPARLPERFGHPSLPRPEGRVVWLHGASVGEAVSLLPLVRAIRAEPDPPAVLVTTGTVSSAARMAASLPEGAVHQFVPVDTRPAVRRFLAHWRPDLAVWIESEIWPRLLVETARAGTPMALVNARLSARSARGWGRVPGMARALFGLFVRIVAQDAETVERLTALGADPARLRLGANLKSAVAVPEAEPEALAAAQEAVGDRRVWLAASTHAGEEEIAADAHARLGAGPLLILAPRHPDRGAEVANLLEARGLTTARRSLGKRPGPETAVWLADTLGEMGLWYRLAPVTFVGGSLALRGGHTPYEPAALGSAILHGPDVANFAPAYAALDAAEGAAEVRDAGSLAAAVRRLLADAPAREAMAEAAAHVRRETTPDVPALARELMALMRASAPAPKEEA